MSDVKIINNLMSETILFGFILLRMRKVTNSDHNINLTSDPASRHQVFGWLGLPFPTS